MDINQLKPLEEESLLRGIPIIGSIKGQWLLKFIQENQPKMILELGTANGYSGIILGSEGAKLITLEINQEIAQEAQNNFLFFKINAKIIVGDGVNSISELNEKFDLIFLDFAKKNYLTVLEDCLRLLNKDGYLIADNIKMEKCTNFKKTILNDKRLETKLIDIADGMSVSKLN